jgi:hypothetical protein
MVDFRMRGLVCGGSVVVDATRSLLGPATLPCDGWNVPLRFRLSNCGGAVRNSHHVGGLGFWEDSGARRLHANEQSSYCYGFHRDGIPVLGRDGRDVHRWLLRGLALRLGVWQGPTVAGGDTGRRGCRIAAPCAPSEAQKKRGERLKSLRACCLLARSLKLRG